MVIDTDGSRVRGSQGEWDDGDLPTRALDSGVERHAAPNANLHVREAPLDVVGCLDIRRNQSQTYAKVVHRQRHRHDIDESRIAPALTDARTIADPTARAASSASRRRKV